MATQPRSERASVNTTISAIFNTKKTMPQESMPAEPARGWEQEVLTRRMEMKAAANRSESGRKMEMLKTGNKDLPNNLSSIENRMLSQIPQCSIGGLRGGLETPVAIFSNPSAIIAEEDIAPTDAIEPNIFGNSAVIPENETATASVSDLKARKEEKSNLNTRPKLKGPGHNRRKAPTYDENTGSKLQTLSSFEGRKVCLLEGILSELKTLNSIQERRLNLDREKFEYKKLSDNIDFMSLMKNT